MFFGVTISGGASAGYGASAGAVDSDPRRLRAFSVASMVFFVVSASITVGSMGAVTAPFCVFFLVIVTTASV